MELYSNIQPSLVGQNYMKTPDLLYGALKLGLLGLKLLDHLTMDDLDYEINLTVSLY